VFTAKRSCCSLSNLSGPPGSTRQRSQCKVRLLKLALLVASALGANARQQRVPRPGCRLRGQGWETSSGGTRSLSVTVPFGPSGCAVPTALQAAGTGYWDFPSSPALAQRRQCHRLQRGAGRAVISPSPGEWPLQNSRFSFPEISKSNHLISEVFGEERF